MFVFREGEHADTGIDDDHGVRIAHGGTIGMFTFFVIILVHLAIGLKRRCQFLFYRIYVREVFVGREVEHQGTDLGAQEMIRATGAHGGKASKVI